jgi:hypothetical protein
MLFDDISALALFEDISAPFFSLEEIETTDASIGCKV